MPINITCPHCARMLIVPDGAGGDFAVCNACGGRVEIPPVHGEAEPISEPPTDMFDAEPYANPFVTPPVSPVPETKRLWIIDRSVCAWVAGGASLVVLLIALVWLGWPQPNPVQAWEEKNQTLVLAYVDDFEASAAAGEFADALEKYSALQKMINDHSITLPSLRAALDRAASEKRKVIIASERQAATRQAIASILTEEAMREKRNFEPVEPKSNRDSAQRSTSNPSSLPTIETPIQLPSFLRVTRGEIPDDPISDERIGAAITKGAGWLLDSFDPRTHYLKDEIASSTDEGNRGGADALCVYALLQCGLSIKDDRLDIHQDVMKDLLRALATIPMEKHIQVYGRGLRASALALLDRKDDRKYLAADTEWLMKHAVNGAYNYGDVAAPGVDDWDNSNSQYGLLGVWAAAETGLDIPTHYWQAVKKHWIDCQGADGGWNYKTLGDTTLSMTLAGVASLLVCHDYLEPAQGSGPDLGRAPYPPALMRGLEWLEAGNHILNAGANWGYTLYGVERVGLASGYKYFGTHDWYRERTQEVLKVQQPNGSWQGDAIETAYALLFLARGRHPIIMNKLRFDGAWSNRPRDAANLAHFASRELERPISFQIVNIEHDFNDWGDAPILYLASHVAPELTDDQVDNIRHYVDSGGLLFTQADGSSPAFDQFARDLAKRLFPKLPLVPMSEDHPVYSVLYKVKPSPLMTVSNGVRTLMVHSPRDLAIAWHHRLGRSSPPAMQLGVNLFLYATGKSELRNRTASTYVPDPPVATGGTLRVARLRYDGLWDPEPNAWPRFARVFQQATSCKIQLMPSEIESLDTLGAPIAHLTGCAAYKWTSGQEEAIRKYVNSGGVLLIDSMGNPQFANSARQTLLRLFPETPLEKLRSTHPLFRPITEGMEKLPSKPHLRPFALGQLERGAGGLEGLSHGKGRVILAPIDLTSGLLGTSTWGIVGYTAQYSESVMKNVLLWTAAAAPWGESQGK